MALHADGRRLVSGSDDKTLRVRDLDTGACLGTWCGADTFGGVDLGKPLTDGRVRIAVGCGNDVLFFELMPPGPLTRSAPIGAPISSLCFSLDGVRLQVATADKTKHILDATTLQPAPPPTCAWADPLSTSSDGA